MNHGSSEWADDFSRSCIILSHISRVCVGGKEGKGGKKWKKVLKKKVSGVEILPEVRSAVWVRPFFKNEHRRPRTHHLIVWFCRLFVRSRTVLDSAFYICHIIHAATPAQYLQFHNQRSEDRGYNQKKKILQLCFSNTYYTLVWSFSTFIRPL